jgi:hypothetical protein
VRLGLMTRANLSTLLGWAALAIQVSGLIGVAWSMFGNGSSDGRTLLISWVCATVAAMVSLSIAGQDRLGRGTGAAGIALALFLAEVIVIVILIFSAGGSTG